jgi:hypothetical protein
MRRFKFEPPVRREKTSGTHRTEATMRTAGPTCVAPRKEHIMFAALSEKLGALFFVSHHDKREAYLASSSDLVDLERRMHHLDSGGHAFGLYSRVMPRDNEL